MASSEGIIACLIWIPARACIWPTGPGLLMFRCTAYQGRHNGRLGLCSGLGGNFVDFLFLLSFF